MHFFRIRETPVNFKEDVLRLFHSENSPGCPLCALPCSVPCGFQVVTRTALAVRWGDRRTYISFPVLPALPRVIWEKGARLNPDTSLLRDSGLWGVTNRNPCTLLTKASSHIPIRGLCLAQACCPLCCFPCPAGPHLERATPGENGLPKAPLIRWPIGPSLYDHHDTEWPGWVPQWTEGEEKQNCPRRTEWAASAHPPIKQTFAEHLLRTWPHPSSRGSARTRQSARPTSWS